MDCKSWSSCKRRKVVSVLLFLAGFAGLIAVAKDSARLNSHSVWEKFQDVTRHQTVILGKGVEHRAKHASDKADRDAVDNPMLQELFARLNATASGKDLNLVSDLIQVPRPASFHVEVEKILIIAHYRGGSSFIGQLFAQHPQIFYMFEPLHPTDYLLGKWRGLLKKSNATDIENRIAVNRGWISRALLGSITQCDFDYALKIVPGVLRDASFVARDMKLVNEVKRPYHCSAKMLSTGGSCVPRVISSCRKSKAVVTKTIRVRMRETVGLLRQDPRLKIVNYVRDPRGVVTSRAAISPGTNVTHEAATLCREIQQDLRVEDAVRAFFPARLVRIRYEDLAADPLSAAKGLYATLGLGALPPAVNRFITLMTGDTYKNMSSRASPWSTARKASETVYRWRKTAKPAVIKAIETTSPCPEVFRKLGYPKTVL